MPSGLKQLMRDHGVMHAVIEAVEREIGAAQAGRPFDAGLVVLALRYLRDFPEWFHHPREEVLFARAIRKDPQCEALLAQVMAEHDRLPPSSQRLLDAFEALAAEARPPQDDLLAELRRYVSDQHRHIQHENEDIFPALSALFDEADWAIDAADLTDPLHGTRDPGLFRPLLERIGVTR
ncbi:hemerythrin domain-containing protein [Azospirillum sp. sgz301742]